MFSHVFQFAKSDPLVRTKMYRLATLALDCYHFLRQSPTLTVQKVEMSFYTFIHIFNLVIFTLYLVWLIQWMARKTKVIIYIEMGKCIDD